MNKSQLIQSLKKQGFSKEILNAFSSVDRTSFIPKNLEHLAYEDIALPIGKGQTISQPYTIATMLSMLELKPRQKILEVGSGCGYVLALLSKIVGDKGKVYGIEIIKELVEKSKQNLKEYDNLSVDYGNGASGLPEYAPFDRILISAACEKFPELLLQQLKPNGIIVGPIHSGYDEQELVALQQDKDKLIIKKHPDRFRFVRFINN